MCIHWYLAINREVILLLSRREHSLCHINLFSQIAFLNFQQFTSIRLGRQMKFYGHNRAVNLHRGCELELNFGPAFANPTVRNSFEFVVGRSKLAVSCIKRVKRLQNLRCILVKSMCFEISWLQSSPNTLTNPAASTSPSLPIRWIPNTDWFETRASAMKMVNIEWLTNKFDFRPIHVVVAEVKVKQSFVGFESSGPALCLACVYFMAFARSIVVVLH